MWGDRIERGGKRNGGDGEHSTLNVQRVERRERSPEGGGGREGVKVGRGGT
jgi:hypothetical protein